MSVTYDRIVAPVDLPARDRLLALLAELEGIGYDFVTVTPATHARVVARPAMAVARDLRDVLGWSRPVARGVLAGSIEAALVDAGVLTPAADGLLAPRLRVSRVEGTLFWHSAYPTIAADSVFLGPDSNRFAQWIIARMDGGARSILDYGAGAGVGGIVAARHADDAELTIADINPKALFLASVNATHAGIRHHTVLARRPAEVQGPFDLVVTHPPFMMDREARAYRDGGDLYGGKLSVDWTVEALDLLAPAGRFVMHTGVSVVDGRDVVLEALRERLPAVGTTLDYRELDPDIFGDELEQPAYAAVERIAAVGAVVRRTA